MFLKMDILQWLTQFPPEIQWLLAIPIEIWMILYILGAAFCGLIQEIMGTIIWWI